MSGNSQYVPSDKADLSAGSECLGSYVSRESHSSAGSVANGCGYLHGRVFAHVPGRIYAGYCRGENFIYGDLSAFCEFNASFEVLGVRHHTDTYQKSLYVHMAFFSGDTVLQLKTGHFLAADYRGYLCSAQYAYRGIGLSALLKHLSCSQLPRAMIVTWEAYLARANASVTAESPPPATATVFPSYIGPSQVPQ